MRCFVTGANGFIGSNLVKKLIRSGHSVKALVLPGTNIENIRSTGCEIITGDLLNVTGFEWHLDGMDVIFHLAGRVSDWGRWKDFYSVNVLATKDLVMRAIQHKVRRFVFISSLAIHKPRGYRDGDESAPRDNTDFPYALSKIMVEDFLDSCYLKGLIETVIIRPGVFPFGPEDRTSFTKIAGAMRKGLFGYVNGGRALLCTAYVENLVDGIVLAGVKEIARGQKYIIGDNVKITWRELIELFAKELKVNSPRINIPYSLAKISAMTMEGIFRLLRIKSPPPLTNYRVSLVAKDFYFNSEKAIQELGYLPSVSIEEGVRRTVRWYRSLFPEDELRNQTDQDREDKG